MPSIYELKPQFQNLLRPICLQLAAKGVSANQVTLAAVVLSAFLGGMLAVFPESSCALFLIPVGLFLRMALNAIDGMLAREHHMQSPLGGILNELGDVFSDALLYLPFALIPGVSPGLIVITIILGIICEMAGVVGFQVGASRRYDGPFGKSDRAFLFGALALALGLGVSAGSWISWLLVIANLLSLRTIWNRSQQALVELTHES